MPASHACAQTAMPALNELFDKVLVRPEVAAVVKPAIDGFADEARRLARAYLFGHYYLSTGSQEKEKCNDRQE